MILRELREGDLELINKLRNDWKVSLRTNGPEMLQRQRDWYNSLLNRQDMRYWAIEENLGDNTMGPLWGLIGQGGFTSISLENRLAEISLIIDPAWRGKRLGEEAVDLLLEQAFKFMNLHSIYGEVYMCNKEGVSFWEKIVKKYKGELVILRDRKFWDGHYSDSLYFTIWGNEYARVQVPGVDKKV